MKTLQKLAQSMPRSTTIANQERHLVNGQVYDQRRSTALAEWRALEQLRHAREIAEL
jgi:hypothetical protein